MAVPLEPFGWPSMTIDTSWTAGADRDRHERQGSRLCTSIGDGQLFDVRVACCS